MAFPPPTTAKSSYGTHVNVIGIADGNVQNPDPAYPQREAETDPASCIHTCGQEHVIAFPALRRKVTVR